MDPILAATFAVLGVLFVAAFAYRRGYGAGLARGFRLADEWRDTAVTLMNTKADNTETLRAIADSCQKSASIYHRRALAMGSMLRGLGYSVQEIEDPATGKVDYRAVMTQPAQRLPLGPSLI